LFFKVATLSAPLTTLKVGTTAMPVLYILHEIRVNIEF